MSLMLASSMMYAVDVNGGFMTPQGIYRTYTLHIPSGYNGSDSIPLVINLHGGNGSASQQASFSQMNPKADAEGFFVLYPNGTMLPTDYTGWNAGEWTNSTVDDVAFISVLIDTMVENYRIDTLRIFATGFSLGAMMCHTLACELSERIAAVAPVEGGLTKDDWNSCQPQRLIPIIHFHHRYDGSVPYYGNPANKWTPPIDSVLRHWANVNGCAIGPDTFFNDSGALRQVWSREDDSCEVMFWTLEQGNGHAWPGSLLGSKELSANDEMWEFFKAHPLPVKKVEPGIEERPGPSFSLDVDCSGFFRNPVPIRFTLENSEYVILDLFDAAGRKTVTLIDGVMSRGEHTIFLDAGSLESGVYFTRLATSGNRAVGVVRIIN